MILKHKTRQRIINLSGNPNHDHSLNKGKLSVLHGSPLRFVTHFMDTRNVLNAIIEHCQLGGCVLHMSNVYEVFVPQTESITPIQTDTSASI